MKFFHYNQNNSGGYFIESDEQGIGTDIIIEAENAEKANDRLRAIGNKYGSDDFWSFCDCCGERWYEQCPGDEGDDVPSFYGRPIEEEKKDTFREQVAVHYANGNFRIWRYDD